MVLLILNGLVLFGIAIVWASAVQDLTQRLILLGIAIGIVLYCILLCCNIVYCIVWYCNGCVGFNTETDIAWYCHWNCIVLHFIVLQYCVLYCVVLQWLCRI